VSPTGPQLAHKTCARRLRGPVGSDSLDERDPSITWYGPARVPPTCPGSEAVIQALCGLMEVNGRDRPMPRRLGIEVASVAAGLLAAQATLSREIALVRGRPVPAMQTSVLQAGLLLMSNYFVVATELGDAVPGGRLPAPGPPFRSAEGVWFEIDTFDPDTWKAFWTRLGAGEADLGRGWTVFQWRYERATCSLPIGLHEATARSPLAQLQQVAADTGISLTALRDYADVLADLDPGEAARPTIRSRDASGPLAHGNGQPAPSTDNTLPLAGIKVVEATSRIQGPFAGMLLRMLGADVARVQPPDGDYGRAALCLHRGKAKVTLDLASPAARAELVALVADADVFLQNWRPGKAAEWGLEFDDLVRRQPRLVYAHTSGWGDRPQARFLMGTDFLVQAYAGLGHALNAEDEPPFTSRMVLCDLFGGLVGAEGVLTALYRREQLGGAWEVESSLLAGAMTLQEHVLEAMAADKEVGRRNGRPVWSVLDRPIVTSEGMLALTVEDDEHFQHVCEVCGIDPAGAPRASTEQRLAGSLADRSAPEWAKLFQDAGVPAAVVCEDLATVPADPRFSELFEPVGVAGRAPRAPWTFA
jgi:CoA:oxalate CoA-transferase